MHNLLLSGYRMIGEPDLDIPIDDDDKNPPDSS
jgi:hypothetical protein